MVDRATGYSQTSLMLSRSMEEVLSMIKLKWFDIHGPPECKSGDSEFNNSDVNALYTERNMKPLPARICSIESPNSSLRLLLTFAQKI